MGSSRPVVDFVIIGAQKSGSTHLLRCIGDHPDIYVCPDEVPFFEERFFHADLLKQLARTVERANPGQLRGITRPVYLAKPECARNIHSVAPEARIIASLRNPVDRAVSAYHWYIQYRLLPIEPVEIGLIRLLEGWTDPRYPRAQEILEFGYYARGLRRYLERFGDDRVWVVPSKRLGEPETFHHLFDFLGVNGDYVPRIIDRRSIEGTSDPLRLRWLRLRPLFGQDWGDQNDYVYRPRRRYHPVRSTISAGFNGVDRYLLRRALSARAAPEISQGLRKRLREFYAEDQQQLAELTGLRLL